MCKHVLFVPLWAMGGKLGVREREIQDSEPLISFFFVSTAQDPAKQKQQSHPWLNQEGNLI